MMRTVRPPAVAGSFYPDKTRELKELVLNLLDRQPSINLPKRVRAIIAPHAGYMYSGPVAASAYTALKPFAESYKRVVVLGPSHFVPVNPPGICAPTVWAFATPLGEVPVDRCALEELVSLYNLELDDEAHRREHSIEVHIPFIQTILRDVRIIPLAVGDARPESVSAFISHFWSDPSTLIVASSDLSHYLDYETARERDELTAQAIESFQYSKIRPNDACGSLVIAGLLLEAQRHGAQIRRLDLRNSGDIAGLSDWVVGYGAWAIY